MRALLWVGVLGSLAAGTAMAAPIRVGPGGDYARIGDAVAAALAAGGTQSVHVARGRFVERIDLTIPAGVEISISGGWNASFTSRAEWDRDNPGNLARNTVIEGVAGGASELLRIIAGGRVNLEALTLTSAGVRLEAAGPAFWISAHGSARVALSQLAVWRYHYRPPSGDGGRGFAQIEARATARVTVLESVFAENLVEATDTAWVSGGLQIGASEAASIDLLDSDLLDNLARANRQGTTAALDVSAADRATVIVEDNRILDNRGESTIVEWGPAVYMTAGFNDPPPDAAPRLVARRNVFLRNAIEGLYQVELHATPGGHLILGDSIVAAGAGRGLTASAAAGGAIDLVNLTLARHPSVGVHSVGAVTLSNTISFLNGTDLVGSPTQSHNLIGSDPSFVNADRDDYRLNLHSPAIDGGDNTPPGGLGPLDVARGVRRAGRGVDVGAHELAVGEPACRVLADIPVAQSAPICRCVSDSGLRAMHCGFPLVDIFASLSVPLRWSPGQTIPAVWTLDPWLGVDGPYSMSAETWQGGQWTPQNWLGPAAPAFSPGKLVKESFRLKLPTNAASPLRTTLKYRQDGQDRQVVVEVLLQQPPKP